ncbi:MAG: hypothetical protein ABSH15_01040 [Verrucomicrobiota bacterium]|jgi:hypothetical protein
MNTETLFEPELVADRRLHLFSLYVDFPAAVRARWVTGQISRLAGKQWKTSAEMWNLDSLTTSEPIRKMITQDVADADVLVIAMSSLDWRELELVEWLNCLTVGKANRPGSGLFIGLLGDGRGEAEELDWTVKQFLRCARQMDRDFIWRWMDRDAMADVDYWLTDSVEALLTRKQPRRNVIFLQEAAIEDF